MIVDCHVHLMEYPNHFNKEIPVNPNDPLNPTVEKLIAAMNGSIDKAIVMGLKAWDTLGIDVPNDYLAEKVSKYQGKLAWCCSVIPTREGAAKEVERCVKQLGAIGVGELVPAYGGYYANDRRAYRVYEKAVELGVPIVIHPGGVDEGRARMKYGNVLNIDDVAIDFPELKIVINHMGWPQYETTCLLMEKHENIFTDVSTLPMLSGLDRTCIQAPLPVVDFPYFNLLYPLLLYFTSHKGDPDRILFGSDWPIVSSTKYVGILTSLNELTKKYGLPEISQLSLHNLLNENWRKVFGSNIFKP